MGKVIDVERYREKMHVFKDRSHAGALLAEQLDDCKEEADYLVIAYLLGVSQLLLKLL